MRQDGAVVGSRFQSLAGLKLDIKARGIVSQYSAGKHEIEGRSKEIQPSETMSGAVSCRGIENNGSLKWCLETKGWSC